MSQTCYLLGELLSDIHKLIHNFCGKVFAEIIVKNTLKMVDSWPHNPDNTQPQSARSSAG